MTAETAILVLGTADWDASIATNQHYMVRELAKFGDAEVMFVESQGLRTPGLHPRDLKRIGRRLARMVSPAKIAASPAERPIPAKAHIVSPLVVPVHTRLTSGLNFRLLARSVDEWLNHPGPRVLWTYTPVTYGLEDYATAAVYHCVDLLGKQAGISESLVEGNERRLAGKSVTAIASSAVVLNHLETVGFPAVLLWENVADLQAIVARSQTAQVTRVPGRVVFGGNLAPHKVDFSILERLADVGLDVVIAGPRADGGGYITRDLARLRDLGVDDRGALSFSDLVDLLRSAHVGVIPYRINEYTKGVSPLKTYEYAAAGLPVVATALPGVRPEPGLVFVEADSDRFVARVKELCQTNPGDLSSDLMRLAGEHSWEGRGRDARLLLSQLLNEEASA